MFCLLPKWSATTNFDYAAKYDGQVEEITPARISEQMTRKIKEMTSRFMI